MKRRILSMLLLVVMLISLFPVQAFAEDTQAESSAVPTDVENGEPQQTEEATQQDDIIPGEEVEIPAMPEPEYEDQTDEDPSLNPETPAEPEDEPKAEEETEAEDGESDDAEKVSIRFNLTPEDLTLKVYSAEAQDAEPISPEEDGSYLLIPGEYYYDAERDGYIPVLAASFTVTESAAIDVTLEEDSVSSAMSVNVASLTYPITGTSGNINWTLDSAGTLTISGAGEMEDYAWNSTLASNSAPWWEYNNIIKTVEIASGVTSIGKYAFGCFRAIESVTIPDTVTKIGQEAFKSCAALKRVTIPYGVKSIEYQTFYFCEALESVTIPNTVTKIGDYAFLGCAALKNVTIPNSVTRIDGYAFANCSALTSVTIPNSVTSIGENAFDSCTALTTVTIDDSAVEINKEAFCKCTALTNLDLGSKVTLIGEAVFSECTALTKVTIPGSVTRIGRSAFYKCAALTDITIPGTVTVIMKSAFEYCDNLKNVYYYGTIKQWNNIEIGDDNECLDKASKHFVDLQVTLDREYITMQVGGAPVALTATVTPADYAEPIEWDVENPDGENIISVDKSSGKITPLKKGTAYAVAKINSVTVARCRVDVTVDSTVDELDYTDNELDIEAVQLGTTSLTTELYSKNYAEFDIVLVLPQNLPDSLKDTSIDTTEEDDKPEDNGVAITDARFTDQNVEPLFDLVVVDDRRLAVVPKIDVTDPAAVKTVKSSYSSKVEVTVGKEDEDECYTTETALKLTVKKTQPKLKASVGAFNSFYSGQSKAIEITGATVTAINRNEDKDTGKSTAVPAWLTLSEDGSGVLSINDNYGLKKNASGSVYLSVETEEWAIDLPVTLSVKNTYKAPKLKLSASSVKFSSVDSYGMELQLLPTVKGETLESLNVTGIESSTKGFEVAEGSFDADTGKFTLEKDPDIKNSGKVTLSVSFGGTTTTVDLTLSAQIITPTIKLKTSTVTLSSKYDDVATVDLVTTPADFKIITPDIGDGFTNIDITTSDENIKAQLNEYGQLVVYAEDGTPENKTYKVTVSIKGTNSKATLTVKTSKKVDPTMTVKATGAIDLTYPDSAVTITPTVKNYSGVFPNYKGTVTVKTGNTTSDSEDIDNYFKVTQNGNVLTLEKKYDVELNVGSTYTATITLVDENNELYVKAKPVKITVKQTAVNLKLSKSSLTLNKEMGDRAEIYITCLTKNYELIAPVIKITDKTGKKIYDGTEGKEKPLDVYHNYGILGIGVNDKTVAGETYKVLVSAGEGYKASTLTVTIPANSTVTATLKAKGSIDTIRDDTKIVFTPTYKNTISEPKKEYILVFASMDGHEYEFVKAYEGLELANYFDADTTLKYKAQVVAMFTDKEEDIVESALIPITVKTGTAKMKVTGTPTLYLKDKNSRGKFALTSTDQTLNGIADVKIKDPKYQNMFELYKYGSGQYAIGFVGDPGETGASRLKTASVTLNIWHTGNDNSSKPDSTVTLKVTLVK